MHPSCRQHDSVPRRPSGIHQKTPRSNEQFQSSCRMKEEISVQKRKKLGGNASLIIAETTK